MRGRLGLLLSEGRLGPVQHDGAAQSKTVQGGSREEEQDQKNRANSLWLGHTVEPAIRSSQYRR